MYEMASLRGHKHTHVHIYTFNKKNNSLGVSTKPATQTTQKSN